MAKERANNQLQGTGDAARVCCNRGVGCQGVIEMHDVFVCHASEDKDSVARPLAEKLRASGLSVWYDEFSLALGDSLRGSIDRGLAESRFGVVILSPCFFSKKWPPAELNGLFAREILGDKTILPVWHNINQAEIAKHSPILADRVAARTLHGLDSVLERILDVVQPGWSHKAGKGLALAISPSSIRLYTGGWGVKTPISVTNRGDSPVYAATLKILIHGPGVFAGSLDMEADPQVPPIEDVIGNIVVSADQVRLNCSNAAKEQIVFFTFHTVPPRGTRVLSIKGTTPVDSTAEITIASFETTPRELLKRGGEELAVLFEPPETVLLHKVGIRMRRLP